MKSLDMMSMGVLLEQWLVRQSFDQSGRGFDSQLGSNQGT